MACAPHLPDPRASSLLPESAPTLQEPMSATSPSPDDPEPVSPKEQELLGLLLEAMMQSGQAVRAAKFRSDHYDHIAVVEALETKGWIRQQDGLYTIQSPVLPLMDTDAARALMARIERIYEVLRAQYRETQDAPVHVSALVDRLGMPRSEVTAALRVMLHVSGWWGGWSTDLGKEDAYVAPAEGVLKHATYALLVEEVRSWSRPAPLAPPTAMALPPVAAQTPADRKAPEPAAQEDLRLAWPPVRACLQEFSFYEIKDVAGLAGFDVTAAAHLEQKAGGGATKGQLMTAVDAQVAKMEPVRRQRFLTVLIEEILRRRPQAQENLDEYLSRLGWSFAGGTLVPLDVFDTRQLAAAPEESHHDLLKAAQRLRDGDLGGAISAACGAVDAATSKVYEQLDLGDPTQASFQERCKKAAAAKGVLPALERQLSALGWSQADVVPFRRNLEGALNQGAFVLQTLRSHMGDVHGTKPVLHSLVFDCLRWAELIVASLVEEPDGD